MLEVAALLLVVAAGAMSRPSTAEAGQARLPRLEEATAAHSSTALKARIQAGLPTGACSLAALATALLINFPIGVLAAPGVFLGARFLLRRLSSAPVKATPDPLLAMCADLLAACLDAGAVPANALSTTGACLPDLLGERVSEAGRALADGATVEQALPESGPLGPIGAVFRRSARTGSSMTDQLIAVAAQLRADDQFRRLERAHRVGVLSALPLGLCMLPAFLLLAVVPAVTGLGAGLLH